MNWNDKPLQKKTREQEEKALNFFGERERKSERQFGV